MFEYGRRRSSAGFVFGALGAAAALVGFPTVTAAPTADGGLGGWFDNASMGRRNSAPDIYERSGSGWRNKNDSKVIKRRSSDQATPIMARRSMDRILRARQGSCLDSTYTEDDINTLLWSGGEGTKVVLCAGAELSLVGPIIYSARNQEISTQGYPTGSSRATLKVTGDDQDVAIWMNCDQCIGTSIRNIQVDGSRPSLGWIAGGSGLIEIGGNAYYQTVDNCNIQHPRGWSALHVIEGWRDSCNSQVITNNQVGPAGTSPNNAQQFHVVMNDFHEFISTPRRLLMERQTQAPGRWADGLSVACRNTTVSGNTIVGATDGAIVLFGSPGSTITGNTIIARGNTLLGGINLVDHGPYAGDYSGTVISGNTILADNAMIKVGVATGLMAWGTYNVSDYRTHGGIIRNNVFRANGGSGYFGYGIAVGGHDNAVVSGNNYDQALFGGAPSYACVNGVIPPFQAAIWSPYTTNGGSYQSGITSLVDFSFLICIMPCQYDSSCAANMRLTGPIAVQAETSTTLSSTASSTSMTSTSTSSSTSTSTTSTSTSISTSSTSTTSSIASSSTTSSSTRTSTTSSSSSTSSSAANSSTSSKATLALGRGGAKGTTTIGTTASGATSTKATLALGRGGSRATKRAEAPQATGNEENVPPPAQVPRKRAADVVEELEARLLVYRDWVMPGQGAVRTPRPKRSILDSNGFDKRQVLADQAYWM